MTNNSAPDKTPAAPPLPAPGFRVNPRVVARVAILLAIICPGVIVTDLLSPRNRHPSEAAPSTSATYPQNAASTSDHLPAGVSP